MKLYCGIDLHSNNSYIVLLDEQDRVVFQKRIPNDLKSILQHLSSYQSEIKGVAVESTYNWYWLVDGEKKIIGQESSRSGRTPRSMM